MNEIKLRPGEEFVYNGIRFICLDVIDGNYLAITADCLCEKRFNDNYNDGCNNWKTSTLRRFLNEDVLEEHFDAKHLIKQTSDLTADNGDKAYGTCEDYVPLLEEYMWTLTPWRCDTGDASYVRYVYPTGAIGNTSAYGSVGLAPVCLFNSNNLTLRRQAQLIPAE